METFVDLEGAIDVGIVDEPFPSDSRSRFLSPIISIESFTEVL